MSNLASLAHAVRQSGTVAAEDFWVLAAFVTGKERALLLAHPEMLLSEEEARRLEDFLEQRAQGKPPVALITGRKEFFGHSFLVNETTLVPRPETEILVESVLARLPEWRARGKSVMVCDIGTGSGAIIVSLTKALSQEMSVRLSFFASDISKGALAVAQQNAANLLGANRISLVTFLHGSLLSPYRTLLKEDAHTIILANLPYLSDTLYAQAPKDVRAFEPKSALWGGTDGLDCYRALFAQAQELAGSFELFIEISPEQEIPLRILSESAFPKATCTFLADLSGQSRIAHIG
ncbi:MAG: peptide chain release factor N(5)-glutamine methyltransferase [Candidatus Moraniibacteriota bacterium]